MAFSLRSVAHSEVGLVRHSNQDSGYVSGTVLAVADGMGGAAAGDVASTVAIKRIAAMDAAQPDKAQLTITDRMIALRGAVAAANNQLRALTSWNSKWEGMGTTVDAAVFNGTQLGFEHIGDSRVYLLRGGVLRRLTRDHSWVQQMVDSGKLTEAEAEAHPNRSLVTRIVNGHEEFRPEFFTLDVELGDRLLLCSDGLCGQVEDDDLRRLLGTPDLAKACNKLTKAARDAGAPDNVTFIVTEVVEPDDALDALPGKLLGAAKTLEVPVVPQSGINDDDTPTVITQRPVGVADNKDTSGTDADEPPEFIAEVTASAHAAEPRRGGRGLLIAVILILAAIIGGVLFAVQRYLQERFYLGPDEQTVAIYQGVPDELFGIPLARVVEWSDVKLVDLPSYYADQVRAFRLQSDTLEGAQQTMDELRSLAEYCVAQREQSAPPTSQPTSGTTSLPPSTPSSPTTATTTPQQRPTPTSAPSQPGNWECP
ncbi:MAG: protein phosphatase 2C domain-containing protein [Propionibacteriaceae bacterium]|jgi:protein phosphatase|nr:protein phosphatase 2C domain-containing protein [Propionibacteriaceae bacterium]